MKTFILKLHIVMAQIMPFVSLIEYIIYGTVWAMIPTFLIIFTIGLYRCSSCGVRIIDERIAGRSLPVSPNIIDRCKVCGRPMELQ